MPASNDLAEDIRMFVDVLAHHKERSFDSVSIKDLQHTGSYLGYRSIIEGKINSFTRTEHTVRVKILPYIAQFYHARDEAPRMAASESLSTEMETGILPFQIGMRFFSIASRIGSMIQ